MGNYYGCRLAATVHQLWMGVNVLILLNICIFLRELHTERVVVSCVRFYTNVFHVGKL